MVTAARDHLPSRIATASTETRGARFVRRISGTGTANMDKTTDELMEMLRGE